MASQQSVSPAVARVWTAVVVPDGLERYRTHFDQHVLPAIRAVDGYLGALLVARAIPDGHAIIVTTRWRSLEAVRGFAGPDLEAAVVDEAVMPLFVRWDRRVWHYDIVRED